jgi:flagellar motor switch protein FliN
MNDWLNTPSDDNDGGSWLGADEPAMPGAPDLPVPTATQPDPAGGSWLESDAASTQSFADSGGSWIDDTSSTDMSGSDGYLGMGSDIQEPVGYGSAPAQAGPPAPRPVPTGHGMAPAGSATAPGEFAIDAPYLEEVRPGRRTLSTQPRGTLTDLVLDVPVPVEVSFGDAMLTVEDFLELGPGAVVELDRAIDAPVELRVRGKLIAHGQLVTVNGRYGLRVTRMSEENS